MGEYDRWQGRYAAPEYIFGEGPNAFLAAQRHLLPARGRALAVADGEGRNGVWLAEQGLDVTFKHVLGNALAMQTLTAGNADLIHADIVQMLQLQGKTPDPHMRAVGMISDKLALSLFFQKGKGINTPKDLEGRSIVDSPGSTAPFTLKQAPRFCSAMPVSGTTMPEPKP